MKPIHIVTGDATAGVVAEQVKALGTTCSWGPVVDGAAKYVVTPRAPAGDRQADRLTAGDLLRGVRNAQEDGRGYTCALFSVVVRPSSERERPREEERPVGRPTATGWRGRRPAAPQPVRIAAAVTCHAAYMPLLERCLAAVEGQTRRPDEKYLALDGCELSRQQQYDLLARGWIIRHDVCGSPNPGRQWALATTGAEWIWHVDADDVHAEGYLAGACTRIGDRRVGIVHADRARSDGTVLSTPAGYEGEALRLRNYVDTSSLWRVHALREAGGWTGTSRWDDWDAALRVTALGWRTARNPVASRCTLHADGSNRNAGGMDVEHVWTGRSWAVVCLLAGRWECWVEWSWAMKQLDLPSRTRLYLVDNSRDEGFGREVAGLASAMAAKGHAVSVIPLDVPYTPEGWLDRHRHVAGLYNRVLPAVTEDMVVFWEDDVLPPGGDALRRLAAHFDPERVGGVCALYESRDRPGGACASRHHGWWSDCPTLAEARGRVMEGMGFLPGGFAVYHGPLVRRALPFAVSFPDGEHLQGWDGQLGATVRENGYRLDLDGTVECEHRWRQT